MFVSLFSLIPAFLAPVNCDFARTVFSQLVAWIVSSREILFHVFSVRFNIQYGRITASETEVEEAAAAADIHDRILTFPNGRC